MTEEKPNECEGTSLYSIKDNALSWYLYIIISLLVTAFFFGHIANHPFDVDDENYINTASLMEQDFFIFLHPDHSLGRPLVQFYIWLAHTYGVDDSFSLHVLNLVFHSIVSILLAVTCRRIGVSLELSFLAGLLFLISTAHFRAVFWISAIAYPLAMNFSLLGILCIMQMHRNNHIAWPLGAYVLFICSVLSHVGAIALWAYSVIFAFTAPRSQKRVVTWMLPLGLLLVMIVFFFAVEYPQTSQVKQAVRLPSIYDLFFNFFWFISRLVTTAHWLHHSIFQYHEWEVPIGVTCFVVLAFYSYSGNNTLRVSIACLLITTLPFLSMSPDYIKTLTTGPSRYLYFSCAAASFILAYLILSIGLSVKRLFGLLSARITTATLLILIFSSSFVSLRKAAVSSTYMEGRNLVASERIEAGVALWEKALRTGSEIIVDHEDLYQRLGLLLPGLSRDTLPLLQRGVLEFPESLWLNAFLAVLEQEQDDRNLRDLGQRRGTQVYAQVGLLKQDLDHNLSALYHNLGVGYMAKKNYSKAVSAFTKALDLQPQKQRTAKMLKKAQEKASVPN